MKGLSRLRDAYDAIPPAGRLRLGAGIAALLVLALLYFAANDQVGKLSRKRTAREAAVAEMLVLKQRHREASASSQRLANRLAATRPDDSPARLIEEIGIKGKNSQIRPLKGEDRPGAVEDAAEVRLDGLTANELVNLLYRLEKGTRPVLVKKALVKSRFDDPSRLDVTLTIALLKPSPQGQR